MEKVRTRLLACSLSACMLATALPLQTVTTAFAAVQAEAARGDVNGDGKTDNADLEALTKLLGEHVETVFAEKQYAAYDITGEGIVDVRDRYALSQYLSGAAKTFPTEYGKQIEDSVTLSLPDTACCQGEQIQVMLSFVDWTKDIAAYDIVLQYDTALKLDSVSFLSGDGQYVAGTQNVKLSGFYSGQSLWRGDLAVLNFTVDGEAEGDYSLKVDGANIFTSGYDYYTSVKPAATVSVEPIDEPFSLHAAAVGSKSISLNWEMLDSGQPISSYRVYRGGELIGETAETKYLDTGLTVGTEYEYTVAGVTENGTETKHSAPVTVKTAGPEIVSAAFPAATVGQANSDLEIVLAQPSPLASLKLNLKGPDGKTTAQTADLEGAELDTVSYHLDVSKLTAGKYEIEAIVSDIDGASSSKTVSVTVQNAAPKPVTLTAKAGSGSVVLSWTLAVEAAACGYTVYRQAADGKTWEKLADVDARDTLTYTDKQLTAGKKYTYAVTVRDSYGMESEKSAAASAVPAADTGVPEITGFTQSAEGRISGKLDLSVTAADDNAVASVAVLLSDDEGKTWKKICEEKGESGSWQINTADYKDGVYQLKAAAYDAEKHEGTSAAAVAMLFDNTAPEQVQNVRTEAVSPINATIAWDDVADEDFSHFIATVSNGNNIKEYTVKKELGLNLSALVPDTEYTVTVYAVDLTGNAGAVSEPLRFISSSDTTAPVITQIYMPSVISAKVPAAFTVYASDSAAVTQIWLQYSQDKKNWKTLTAYANRSSGSFTISDESLKEGELYIRAYAADSYGNTGDPEKALVQKLTVDNTAPEAPVNLTVTADLRSNTVKWEKPASGNAVSYRLERAAGKNSTAFTVLLDHDSRTSYPDSAVKSDETYTYRVAAYDQAGNCSAYSAPVSVTRTPDKAEPQITSCYLSNNGIVSSAHRTLQVIASDNVRVESIAAAYRCKETDDWKALTVKTAEVNSTQTEMRVQTVLPESILKESQVTVQITVKDASENQCQKEYTFTVDDSRAEIKNFAAKQESDRMTLSWSCADSSKVQAFRVLRRIGSGDDICMNVMPPHKDAGYSYEDTKLTVSGVYTYSISALMQNGNEVIVSLDPIKVQAVPKAVLHCQTAQVLGAEFTYSAQDSQNPDEITQVKLSYGDGESDLADTVKEAVFTHTYKEAGVYEVVLTVTNAAGFSDTETVSVTVAEASKMAAVTAVVKTMSGEPAAHTAVFVDVGTENQARYETDDQGKVEFVSTAGTHEIGVYGSGYLPVTKTVELTAGSSNTVSLSVEKDQLVDASFNVQRMTLAQIKAAGISVADPANCNIVNINVELKYESKTDDDHLSVVIDLDSGRVYAIDHSGTSSYTYNVHSVSKDANTVVLMRVPAKVQFLKEFFQIDMILLNKAAADFALTDCTVSLNLPAGLSLMEDSSKSAERVVSFDRLAGGSQKKISWIIRGDRSGDYSFSADFSATLQPFNEPIAMNFPSDKNIHVYGQHAADVTVNFNPFMSGKTLLAELVVENKSPVDLNELQTDIGDVLSNQLGSTAKPASVKPFQTRFTGTDKIVKVIANTEKISVLKPGEKYSVVYRISGLDNPYIFKRLDAVKSAMKSEAASNVKVQIAPVRLVNVNDPFYGIQFDPDKDFLFMVKNKNGEEVENASVSIQVTVNGAASVFTGTTDERGRLVVPRGDAGTSGKLTIEAENYKPYTEWRYDFPASKAYRTDTFVLAGDYEDSDFALTYASVNGTNVLRRAYVVDRGSGDEFTLNVTCRSEVEKFELMQGDRVIQTVEQKGTTAAFTGLSGKNFREGNDISVRVTAELGDPFRTPLMFKIVNPSPATYQSMLDDIRSHFSGGAAISIPAPPAVAEWGGDLDLTIPFPDLSAFDEASSDDEKKDDDDDDHSSTDWDAAIEITETSCTATFGIEHTIEIEIGSSAELDFSIGVEFEASIDIETQEASVSGTINVGISGSASTTLFQTLEPIPFFVAIELGASFGASAGVQYTYYFEEPSRSGWSYSISGTAGISVTPELGLGVDDVASISVYGTAGLNISGLLAASEYDPELDRVWLDGSVGIRGELLDWELFDLTVFSGSVTFYPRSSGRPRVMNGYGLQSADGTPVVSTVSDPELYRPFTADEIPEAGAWNGALTADSTAVLRSGISGCSAPVLACDGTNAVLVWIEKDLSRGISNAPYAVYSVYDAASKTWSEPAAVDDNQNADTTPVLYAGADGIRLAYLESGAVFADADETPSLNDYAKQLVFKTAKFDPEASGFTDFRTLPVNEAGGYASAPAFVQAADGKTYLFWRSNANGLIFGNDESNAILCAEETETGWSEPKTLISGQPAICALTCGSGQDGEPLCAFVTDADSDAADTADRKLLVTDLAGNVRELAEGGVSAPQFTALPDSGAAGLVWYQDGKLFAARDFSAAEELLDGTAFGLTDRFAVAGDQVLFLRNTDAGAALFRMQYDSENEAFTDAVCIESGKDLYYERFAVTAMGDDMLYVMTRSEAELSDGKIARSSALTGGILHDTTDLSISDLKFTPADVNGGAALPLTLNVRNAGTLAADTLTLKILDESGSEIASDVQTVSIGSGKSESVTFHPVLPEKTAAAVYTVSVTAGETDRTPEDNQTELDLTKTDIAVRTELEYEGDRTLVTIYAENESNVPAAVCLHVKPMRADEETLELISDVIEPHKSAFWQLDSAELLGDCYRSFVLITAETEEADACMKNNSTTVMISKSGFDPGVLGDINLDGDIELADSVLALKCYTRQVALLDDLGLTPVQMRCGDVDKNGVVDLYDSMLLLRYYVDRHVSGNTTLEFPEYVANKMNGGAEA